MEVLLRDGWGDVTMRECAAISVPRFHVRRRSAATAACTAVARATHLPRTEAHRLMRAQQRRSVLRNPKQDKAQKLIIT
ncbi:MAG: hypothetical protein REI94_21050, partial [Moraxellaceae bacterium]|nr:hypothetical protein [Moraxellaceae bacterium]